jgi:hypothetical protein
MTDVVIKGKIYVPGIEDLFYEDFDKLLQKHDARFDGSIKAYQFDDCEVISDEKDRY